MHRPGLVFVHLRKAFDTVCHQIILTILKHCGIRGLTEHYGNLICSYLQDRKWFVSPNQTRSDLGNIQLRVPKGSSLGPLFFLIYINDLSNAVSCKSRFFTDDICVVEKATSPESYKMK